jgi:Domain of unknown function (DUF4265)
MDHVKIFFRLEQDEDGYPPVSVESVWAKDQGDGSFVLDNTPWFTREATLGDVVEADEEDGALYYRATRRVSGSSLLRVIFLTDEDPTPVRNVLVELGCSSEMAGVWPLLAVNVPAEADLDAVRAVLDEGEGEGRWEYEEAILRHGRRRPRR